MNDWKKRLVCNVSLFCTQSDEDTLTEIFSRTGLSDARNVLITNFEGYIVRPPSPSGSTKLTWGDMWYIQNLMILQRMTQVDIAVKQLKDRGVI